MVEPYTPRWEDIEDREDRCPKCWHWWGSHGVPGEELYGCNGSSWYEAELAGHQCGCTFAEGNTVTPRQVRIWTDGTSWPLAPWGRADCPHRRRDGQQCLDCGVVIGAL